ncbi:hypothetical protein [Litorivivens sp.]|uniref:hypothetical protein n=1 Tax=Litorivivens sp. TaxID=2020868 RepID=UPI00356680D1
MRTIVALSIVCLTACSELATVHYVNALDPAYGAPATGYRDTDGDGVMDFGDLCPRTQPGRSVTVYGCEPSVASQVRDDLNCYAEQNSAMPLASSTVIKPAASATP